MNEKAIELLENAKSLLEDCDDYIAATDGDDSVQLCDCCKDWISKYEALAELSKPEEKPEPRCKVCQDKKWILGRGEEIHNTGDVPNRSLKIPCPYCPEEVKQETSEFTKVARKLINECTHGKHTNVIGSNLLLVRLDQACNKIDALEAENERLKNAIIDFGNNPTGFDWAVLGKLDKQEQEIERLTDENKKLKDRERKLNALESTGVDNWEGYDMAMDRL
jgi:hypothetical protein